MGCHKQSKLACKFGNLTNHYRVGNLTTPDYSVQDHTPKRVDTHLLIIKPVSPKDSEIKLANMEIFRVLGPLSDIQQGDILETDKTKSVNTVPTITIYQLGLATLGFKTDRVGDICNGEDVVYSNIKFAFLPSTDYQGRPLNREIMETMDIPSIEVITYDKSLYSDTRDAEGLQLVQTDISPNLKWTITNVVNFGVAQVLTLKRGWVS